MRLIPLTFNWKPRKAPLSFWFKIAFAIYLGHSFSAPALAQQKITTVVSLSGGTIHGPDGVSLTIPRGAITQSTEVTIERVNPRTLCKTIDNHVEAVGNYYRITSGEVIDAKSLSIKLVMPMPQGFALQNVFAYTYSWSEYATDINTPPQFFWSGYFPRYDAATNGFEFSLSILYPESKTFVLVRRKQQ